MKHINAGNAGIRIFVGESKSTAGGAQSANMMNLPQVGLSLNE